MLAALRPPRGRSCRPSALKRTVQRDAGEKVGRSDIDPHQVWSMSEREHRTAWRLVGRQHGIVARAQLLALGFSPAAIQHRIAYGRLHPVARGIYAVGWPYLDRRRRWAAAVLAAAAGDKAAHSPTQPYLGNGVALSHRSAAALWGIGREQPGRIDLSVLRAQAVHRRSTRPPPPLLVGVRDPAP